MTYTRVVCLTHTEASEIFITCPHRHINVLSVHHGYQDVTLDDQVTCSYIATDDVTYACVDHTQRVQEEVREMCQGEEQCRFLFRSEFVTKCGKISNFAQLAYECVGGRIAKKLVSDI